MTPSRLRSRWMYAQSGRARSRIGAARATALNGETAAADSEANEREIEEVGKVDADGQIERENGGRRCDQTRRPITPGAAVRSHPSRRRWGRIPV